MKIQIAEHSGYCYGVKRAINILESLIEEESIVYTLGPIIHNKQVTDYYEKKGVIVIENLSDIIDNEKTIVIRSHGAPKIIYTEAENRHIRILDATCPYVKKIQNTVSSYASKGYNIIIVGNADHPEVIGINGWCDNQATIIDHIEQVEALKNHNFPVCVVAQTTFSVQQWALISERLKDKFSDIVICNTICLATEQRQQACLALAKTVDYMVVVGGKHSSNTKKLAEMCRQFVKTIHIETKDDLDVDALAGAVTIGITAGASTPDWIVQSVILKIENEGEVIFLMDNHNSMAEMMEQIEESLKIPRRGSIVKGSIIQVNANVIIVNIGYKSDGVIPRNEVSADSNFDLQKNFKEGDQIDVFIVSHDNGEGNILLSLRKVNADKDWEELEAIHEKDEPIMVKVSEAVNGGLIAFFKEIRGFIPASQLSDRFVKNLKPFIGQELKVKVIEINRQKRRAVFSHKEFAMIEKEAAKENFWTNIQVGQVVKGEVKRITNFGAFVDIGGMDGLVHVTEMSWGRIKPANEFVTVGQMVDVKIIDANRDENKISLSIKQLSEEPWASFDKKYEVNGIYTGKVVNLTDFGAFVELEPGIEGLVHVSHIAKEHVEKPADVLRVNQSVEVRILEYVAEEKKVKLSI